MEDQLLVKEWKGLPDVHRDVDELDEVTNEPHDSESDGNGLAYLRKL